MRYQTVFAIFVSLVPAGAMAQHRGGGPTAAPIVAQRAAIPAAGVGVAPRGAVHVAQGTHVGVSSGAVRRAQVNLATGQRVNRGSLGFRNLPVFRENAGTTPGLGFDYPHLAAANGGRVHNNHFGAAGGLGFGGFLLSPPMVIVEEGQLQPAESQEAKPEQAGAVDAAERDDLRYLERPTRSEPRVEAGPQHEASEYVFVRRDGGLVFAVAYSWENGALHYVTRDGLRRSLLRDALDMDATQQFNEQRGLNFRVPV